MSAAISTSSSSKNGQSASQGQSAKKAKVALGPLGKVKWKRVVADEGHVLKNPKAKSMSICHSCMPDLHLHAQREGAEL